MQIIESLVVKAGLLDTNDAINRWQEATKSEMVAFLNNVPSESAVWCVGESAIIAYRLTNATTEIQRVAVRNIHPNYDPLANKVMDELALYFAKAGLIANRQNHAIDWLESEFLEYWKWRTAEPRLNNEKSYKGFRRRFYLDKKNKVAWRIKGKRRKYTPSQIEKEVDIDWKLLNENFKRIKEGLPYLREVWNLSTPKATSRYLLSQPLGVLNERVQTPTTKQLGAKAPTRLHRMSIGTQAKLEKIREERQKSISNGRVKLFKTAACEGVKIDPKTVREHAPELWKNWNDKEYKE